jgi:hypothetical protein
VPPSGKTLLLAAAVTLAGAAPFEAHAGGLAESATPGILPDLTRAPVPVVPPVLEGDRASGSVFIGYRGGDGRTTGAVATLAPGRGSFLRVGAEATPGAAGGDVRVLWDVGFESARASTFFAHVHDTGAVSGVAPPLTLRSAEASAGYTLPALCGGPFCLASSAFATLPFTGGPTLGGRMTLGIGRAWFVTGAVGWTIPEARGAADAPPWRVSFALGRADWRPGGLFVTYRDDVALDRLRVWSTSERQGSGVLTAGVSWAY